MRDENLPDPRQAALLLDEDRKRMLAYLDPLVINAYAGEYAEAMEFQDADTLRYLDENLFLSMSKKGFRSNQIVEMSNAREAARMAQERMSSPTFNVNAASGKEAPKRGLFG